MSGAQTSTFPTMNDLLAPMAAYDTHANALLLQQQHQQEISDHDIAAVGQAAAPLLGMSEEDAAKAYPGWLQDMQSRGLAKYAPPTYPGHATTAALVQRAMPLIDQYKMGLMTSPGTQAILDRVFGTGGGGTGTGSGATTGATTIGGTDTAPINAAGDSRTRKAGEGGPPAAGTPGAQVAQQVHDFWISKGYSEEQVAGIMAGGPGSESDFTPSVFGDKGSSYGLYQHHGPRLAAMQQFFGLSGSQMPSADQQNQYAAWEISPQGPLANVGAQLKQAKTPAEAAAIWTAGFGVPADKTEIGRRARGADRYLNRYAGRPGAPGGATAPGVVTGDVGRPDLAPPPPGGTAGAYPAMGAGVGAVVGQGVRPNIGGPQLGVAPPPVIRAQPIPAGRTTVGSNADIMMGGVQQAQATPLSGTRVAGPPMVASTNPTAPVAAPSVEPPPQPGWGSTVGSYGPQNTLAPPPPPAPPAVAAAPASQQPPAAAPSVATGVNSPQFQLAQQKLRQAAAIAAMPGYAYNPQLQAAAAYLKEQAAAYAQADSVVQGPGGVQIHTLTGKQDDPAKPLADYKETSPGSGIWVGGPGTEPRFQPPGRLVVTPGGDVYQTTTGGAVLLKHTDPAAVAALEEAKAAGSATGKAVAEQLPNLMLQARNAAAQEGQIDYASNQLREAAKGGVPSGYFSQGLATAAAAAKSLGLDTAKLGINPEAVGNIQTAQKTLSVIGGAILRQALGPGSAITDGKIEQFIHTQPGIETDPQALQRIMAWARSQYTYERELGHAAVSEAAKPENAGRLPPHWLPAYYRDHGFAPIYDPGTQEMQQPDGRQPTRETPPASQNAPNFQEGQTATAKDGHKIVFRNGNWVPQ